VAGRLNPLGWRPAPATLQDPKFHPAITRARPGLISLPPSPGICPEYPPFAFEHTHPAIGRAVRRTHRLHSAAGST